MPISPLEARGEKPSEKEKELIGYISGCIDQVYKKERFHDGDWIRIPKSSSPNYVLNIGLIDYSDLPNNAKYIEKGPIIKGLSALYEEAGWFGLNIQETEWNYYINLVDTKD